MSFNHFGSRIKHSYLRIYEELVWKEFPRSFSNRPRSIYQYSSMAPRLSGKNCKFFKFLLSSNSQKRLRYKENKTFNKRKNRALLTFRRLQKHYEIFSYNVLQKNITRKQFRVNLVPRVSHLTAPLARPRGW